MPHFAINKTGHPIPIYDVDKGGAKVGTINDREAFIYLGGESCQLIDFLSPSGFIRANLGIDGEDIICDYCTSYPYGEEVIDGVTYGIYKMRKSKNIYKADGSYWGKVAAGMFVATNSSKVGETHTTWKLINYVKNTSGQWIKVTGAGYNHGFVDTGLDTSSGYGTVAFYGSW